MSSRWQAQPREQDDGGVLGPNDCLACGGKLVSMGVHDIRFGGSFGGIKLLLGEWAEIGEGKLPLEVMACRECRRVEFKLGY